MLLRSSFICRLATAIFTLFISAQSIAAPASDSILPVSTKGYFAVENLEKLSENWERTMLGELSRDEAMKPFMEGLREQLERKVANVKKKIGVTFSDLKDIATGEVSLSTIQVDAKTVAVALTADVRGNEAKTKELLKRVDRTMSSRRASKKTQTVEGTAITIYGVPATAGAPPQNIAIFVKDGMLVATNSPRVSSDILGRFSGTSKDNLKNLEAYQATMDRCQRSVAGISPDLRWFLDPFGYTHATRMSTGKKRRTRKGKDMAAILQRQGFDAITGVGGFVNFYVDGKYEILHRTAVYAPKDKQSKDGEKYRLAMRMLDLPVGGQLSPQSWVPRDVATYSSFNINIKNAFKYLPSLANEFMGEGNFELVLEGIETQEFGPRVNIARDLIAHLGQRVTVLTDYQLPISTKSERFLFSVETTNEKALADTIEKLMESDKNAKKHIFGKHVIWELVENAIGDDDLPEEWDDLPIDDPIPTDEDEDGAQNGPTFPKSCVCVAKGHLFFASNVDYMKRILTPAEERETLTHSADFNQIQAALGQLVQADVCMRSFSRTDEEYRPTYELLRQGKMPESETLLGRILNEMLTDEDELVRKQKFDGSKLPNFEVVRRYFGPAGIAILPEENGWFMIGTILRKDAP